MTVTTYGDISPRTAAYAAKNLLERGIPYLVFEKFGQSHPIPSKNSKVQKFRRYSALDATPAALTEGVQPSAKQLTSTDVTATLIQYGDVVEITDVVMDTHEDNVLAEATDILGEQAAQLLETARFNILKAGSNIQRANGAARDDINTALSIDVQRRCVRTLKRNNAKRHTKIIRSTPAYGMENVAPAYVAVCHPDCEPAIRALAGFVPAEKYGTVSPWENELGKVEDVRYVTSTIIVPWADAGADKGTMLSTTGVKADIYPILYLARDAYGLVPLKGKNAITPMVLNPGIPRMGDALGQKGSVGWKTYSATVILNDDWMVRAEVGVAA